MRGNNELFKNALVGTRKATVTLEKEGLVRNYVKESSYMLQKNKKVLNISYMIGVMKNWRGNPCCTELTYVY